MLSKTVFSVSAVILLCLASANFVQAQSDIRKVDFSNFTYEASCAGEETEKITVKESKFSKEETKDGYTDRFYFGVENPVYGDVNGDGKDDAIILSICNTGGTGNFSEGFIYGMSGGKPALLGRIPGGDRAYGGLREVRVEDGLIIVESNDVGEAGGACCPEVIVTSYYRLKGGKLEETKASSRRDIYPAERVAFEKGKFATTVNVTLKQNDDGIKRFVVGARAGQTLTVTSDQPKDKIEVSIVRGDAESTEIAQGISAKLNKSGDFVIQVRAYSETDVTASVKIEIR